MINFLHKMPCTFLLLFFACIQNTEGQIVYTDMVPDKVFSSSNFSVDLNQDSIVDFNFTLTSINSSPATCGVNGSRVNKYLRVTPADTNNYILNNSNQPSALALSTAIDSSSQVWRNTASQLMASDSFYCRASSFPRGGGRPAWVNVGFGNFRNATDKCLAVRFFAGTQLYYGWIRFSVTSNGMTVTLKDYAYQSSGTPFIFAGQNNDNYKFITTVAATVNRLCAGSNLNVGCVMFGDFDSTNVVSVELSDSLGKFTKGTIIGSQSRTVSGTIPCVIPPSISGTAFRFRVISTSSVLTLTASDNGTNLIINNKLPDSLITPANNRVICSGTTVALSASFGMVNLYQWKKDSVNISGSTNRIYVANTTGLFSCDVTNGCGTVHSNVVSITVNPSLPAVSITPSGPLTINLGDSVLLTSSAVDPSLIYNWYRNDILLNPNKSATTYMAKFAGVYTHKIFDSLSICSKTSPNVVIIIQTPNAVPEAYSLQSNFKIQPNPFNSEVFISFSIQERQNFSLKIVDLTGRLVKTIAADVSGQGKFEYNWLANEENGNAVNAGIYYLILEADNFSQTQKLVLVR